MLKLLFGMIPWFEGLGIKTCKSGGHPKSKLLLSWGYLSGWLDAESFDLGWPSGLEVWEFKPSNRGAIPNRSIYHPGAWPQDVKSFEFKVLGAKSIEVEGFNILGTSVSLAGC